MAVSRIHGMHQLRIQQVSKHFQTFGVSQQKWLSSMKDLSYEVTFEVTDSDGATTNKTITVTVEDEEATDPPAEDPDKLVILAEDVTITKGETFDDLECITATDHKGNDITDAIKVVEETIDTDTIGSYDVTYEVTDSDEQTATKTITVTVVEKNDEKEEPSTPDTGGDDSGSSDKNDGSKQQQICIHGY